MSRDPRFTFSHRTTVFTFTGRRLDPPKPGSYDPAAYTPPTRQIFKVEMQDDGIWRVLLFGTEVASGDSGQSASRHNAATILEKHCSHLLHRNETSEA
jgi:hypothetical protein